MRRLVGAVALTLLLSGCGYDGWVRYECQEYKNWNKDRCKPPACEVVGTCTKDLLPKDIYEAPNT